MAGELVSFRHIVDGRTCLDWYVLNVGDEQSFFSIAKELCKTSAEEKRPPQFRFAIPGKSAEEEDQAELVVALLLREKGPRRSYCQGERLS